MTKNINEFGSSDSNISIIDKSANNNVCIEVHQYENLYGLSDIRMATDLYFMEEQNIKARQVHVHLRNSGIQIEPGAMSYFVGDIEMVSGVTVGNALGRVFKAVTTGEKFAQPIYKGTGTVVLEPSFKHFITIELEAGEVITVDKGMFYCAQDTVHVDPIILQNVSSAILGGEGIFQLALKGPGLAVLECPVPMCEIKKIPLNNTTLKVDGNFDVLRTGNIKFTVERSAKTLLGSVVAGEGLVNVYTGTGEVWLAPTIKVYDTMRRASMIGTGNTNAMNMNTSNNRTT